MSFTKLFSSITESTIWDQPNHVRIVWITMLAMADRHGLVMSSIPGLAHRSRVTNAEAEEAIGVFLAEDRYSRTRDYDGRRVMEIDGGWLLLNYDKYREVQDAERAKESKRRWAQKHRESVDASREPISTVDAIVPSRISPSASSSVSSDPDRSLEEPDQVTSPPVGVVAPTPDEPRGRKAAVNDLDGWEPKPELFARALELGLSREVVEDRIAALRLGPVGGTRGIFPSKIDAYMLKQLPNWRAWHETAQHQAVHRPGSPSGGGGGGWKGNGFRPILEPTAKHAAFAQLHGLDLPAMVRELQQSDVIDQLGAKRALEMLGERMSLAVRKRREQGAA